MIIKTPQEEIIMQPPDNRNFLELLKQDYPEELEPNGFVEQTRNRFLYLDQHPEEWKREAKWVREAWMQNPEKAVLKYSYEFLQSFA